MIMANFPYVHFDIKYGLFKTFCMPLYGCTLWNHTGCNIKRFHVAWRKCVRRILGVPNTTHCNLLPYICGDNDVNSQLLSRFIKMLKTTVRSGNIVSNICVKLAINGSRSNVSNNISLITEMYGVSRDNMLYMTGRGLQSPRDNQLSDTASVIRDILNGEIDLLTHNENVHMLHVLCTD